MRQQWCDDNVGKNDDNAGDRYNSDDDDDRYNGDDGDDVHYNGDRDSGTIEALAGCILVRSGMTDGEGSFAWRTSNKQ